MRRHFGLYTVLAEYDESLAALSAGQTKRIKVVFLNRLFTPQYLTVRILDVPEDWKVRPGREFCVGLEHAGIRPGGAGERLLHADFGNIDQRKNE